MCGLIQEWVKLAPGATPVVALVALLFAWRQLVHNRASQRENTAKATFREYLKLAVQYPDLANGQCPADQAGKGRYEWFVGYLLWAAEEILEYAATDKVWQFNLQMILAKHCAYFQTSEFKEELPGYSVKLQELIEKAIRQKTPASSTA